nr:hypothetical protein CFP56_72686 [Quercus suber]
MRQQLTCEIPSYPVVSATDAKTSRILLIVVLALHAGLAIAIKILFFAHGSPAVKGDSPAAAPETPSEGDGAGDGAAEAMVRMLLRV